MHQNRNQQRNYPPSRGWAKPNNAKPIYIEYGTCGLFFTVDGEEKRAVIEARNILDVFSADSNFINAAAGDSAPKKEGEDVSDQLTQVCESTKNATKLNCGPGFRQLDSGVRNTLLFSSPAVIPGNVYQFADSIVDDCQKNQRCRFLARVLPVEDMCSVNMEAITESLKRLISRHLDLSSTIINHAPSYAVDYKARNSHILKRQEIYDAVTTIMGELSPDSKVNLTEPDLVFAVNVIPRIAMLSCLRDYFQRNKFSIRVPSEKEDKEKADKKQDKDTEAEE